MDKIIPPINLKISGVKLPPIEAPELEEKVRKAEKEIQSYVDEIIKQAGFEGASLFERLGMYAVICTMKVYELEEENQEMRNYFSHRLKSLEEIIRNASN